MEITFNQPEEADVTIKKIRQLTKARFVEFRGDDETGKITLFYRMGYVENEVTVYTDEKYQIDITGDEFFYDCENYVTIKEVLKSYAAFKIQEKHGEGIVT